MKIFFIASAIVIALFSPSATTLVPCERSLDVEPKYFLVLISVIGPDDDILAEWIEHYIHEGVEHFYLGLHRANNDTRRLLTRFVDVGLVTLLDNTFYDNRHLTPTPQIRLLRDMWTRFALNASSEFALVVDTDEYAFAKANNDTLACYLTRLPYIFNAVQLHFFMFGSSNHSNQPMSIRESFVYRHAQLENDGKQIVRSNRVAQLNVHQHSFLDRAHLGSSEYDERVLRDHRHLQLNHYKIMSKKRFFAKKVVERGPSGQLAMRAWTMAGSNRLYKPSAFLLDPNGYWNIVDRNSTFYDDLLRRKQRNVSYAKSSRRYMVWLCHAQATHMKSRCHGSV